MKNVYVVNLIVGCTILTSNAANKRQNCGTCVHDRSEKITIAKSSEPVTGEMMPDMALVKQQVDPDMAENKR